VTKKQALDQVRLISRKIAKGETDLDSWKWRRADSMTVASEAGANLREIGAAAGLSHQPVKEHLSIVSAYPDKKRRPSFSEAYKIVTGDKVARLEELQTKRQLEKAPMERIERIMSELPRERQEAIAAAAGSSFHQARQEAREHERNLTDRERRERDEAVDRISRPIKRAAAGFTALGIIGHLDQATEELRELNADASVTPELARKIERAHDRFERELRFAWQMLGEEASS